MTGNNLLCPMLDFVRANDLFIAVIQYFIFIRTHFYKKIEARYNQNLRYFLKKFAGWNSLEDKKIRTFWASIRTWNSLKSAYVVVFGQKMFKRSIKMQNYVTILQFEVNFQALVTYFWEIFQKCRKYAVRTPEIKKKNKKIQHQNSWR